MTACENLKSYLDTAATFDGREVLFDFSTGDAQAVAQASTPMLIQAPRAEHISEPATAEQAEDAEYEELPHAGYAEPQHQPNSESFDQFVSSLKSGWSNLEDRQRKIIIGVAIVFVLILLFHH